MAGSREEITVRNTVKGRIDLGNGSDTETRGNDACKSRIIWRFMSNN